MRRRRPVLWYQVVPNQMSKRRHRSVSLTGKTPPSSPHLSSLHLRSFLGSRPDAPRPSANPFFSGPQHAGHALFTCCVSRPRRAMPQNANVRSFTRQPHNEDSTTAQQRLEFQNRMPSYCVHPRIPTAYNYMLYKLSSLCHDTTVGFSSAKAQNVAYRLAVITQ